LIDYLVRQADEQIYYLAVSRPVLPRSPFNALLQSLTREDRITRIPLARLEAGEIALLSTQVSPHSAETLANWLMKHSEGNPYVLAELIRFAREKKILSPDGRLDESLLSASPPLPSTIYSLIQARLSHLSDPARRILDAAVAMGRNFEFDVVARAAALSENAALDGLDELRLAGLILPLEGMDYTFDHTLTMEVAYREGSEPRHRLLHRRVAEAIESLYNLPRLESNAGILAFHYFEGNVPDRAVQYAMKAGREAMTVAGWKEAISLSSLILAASPPNKGTCPRPLPFTGTLYNQPNRLRPNWDLLSTSWPATTLPITCCWPEIHPPASMPRLACRWPSIEGPSGYNPTSIPPWERYLWLKASSTQPNAFSPRVWRWPSGSLSLSG
jgi:predicted ATPase